MHEVGKDSILMKKAKAAFLGVGIIVVDRVSIARNLGERKKVLLRKCGSPTLIRVTKLKVLEVF